MLLMTLRSMKLPFLKLGKKKENPLQGKIATLMRICEVEEVVEVIETVDENLQSSQGRIFID